MIESTNLQAPLTRTGALPDEKGYAPAPLPFLHGRPAAPVALVHPHRRPPTRSGVARLPASVVCRTPGETLMCEARGTAQAYTQGPGEGGSSSKDGINQLIKI